MKRLLFAIVFVCLLAMPGQAWFFSGPGAGGGITTLPVPVGQGGTGAATYALNGVLYGNTASAIGVTAIGAAGQLLRVGASPFVPAWSTSTFADTYVQGGLLHAATANTIAALNPGAVGSFLMSNGASAALSYLAPGADGYMLVGGGVTTIPTWTASTGTGAPVRATSPALVTPTHTVSEIVVAATGNLSAAQLSGTQLNNYGQTDDNTQSLAAIASGLSFDTILGTTVAKYFRLDPGASDSIYLDGVSCTDGKYIGVASAAIGNAVSCKSFQTGATPDYDWFCVTVFGAWACE